MATAGTCRLCGCTEDRACEGGCSWADDAKTLCSACVCGPVNWRPTGDGEAAAEWMGMIGKIEGRPHASGGTRWRSKVLYENTGRLAFDGLRESIEPKTEDSAKRLCALVMCCLAYAAGGVLEDAEDEEAAA